MVSVVEQEREQMLKDSSLVSAPPVDKVILRKGMSGALAKYLVDATNERAEKDFKGAKAFTGHWKFNENGYIEGSTPFRWILVNDELGGKLQTPTAQDYEILLAKGALNRGFFRDHGILVNALIDNYGPNNVLLESMLKRLKGVELPVYIPLKSLGLGKASNFYGAKLVLKRDAEIIPAPSLVVENNGKKFNGTNRYGLPEDFVEKGSRTAYIRNGLSGCFLGGYFDWSAGRYDLVFSSGNGRGEFVCSEAAAKNLSLEFQKMVQGEADFAAQRFYETHQLRTQRALDVLKGK